MSDWYQREERERFDAWLSSTGAYECETCGALVRDDELHDAWHASSRSGGTA